MKLKALQTLSDSEKIYISKGREYEVVRKDNWSYVTTDNYGDELLLTEEAVSYKFEAVQ